MRTVEDVVDACGGFGRFQWILLVAIDGSLPGQIWSSLFMSFAGKFPEWYCETSDWGGQDNVSVTENPDHFGVCSVNGTSCERYHYLGDIWTVMKEWNLVCDLEWVKATAISVQMSGTMTGAIIGGQLGDLLGRKTTVYFSLASLGLINIGTAFSVSWQMFVVCRFLIGYTNGSVYVTSYTLLIEFMPVKWRALISLMPQYPVSVACFGLVAYLLPNWKHMHLIIGISLLLTLLGCLWVPESPRWLTVHGRVDEAVAVLHKVARTNRKELPADAKEVLQAVVKRQKVLKKHTYLDLFKHWRFARITVTICYYWFSLALIYYGIAFGVSSLSGNIYINIAIMGLIEIPLLPLAFILTNKYGRRFMVVFTFGLAGVASLACMVLQLYNETGIALNVLSLAARSFIGIAWCVNVSWVGELYPTVIRNLGFGSGDTAARIGGMVAPFLINLDDSVVQTYSVIGALCLVAVILAFTLEETKGKVMKDTVRGNESELLEQTLTVMPNEAGLEENGVKKEKSHGTNGLKEVQESAVEFTSP